MYLSIITPTSNSASTIEDCVMSIINQQITNFEHIIVDNLSSDSTLDLIKSIYHREGLLNNLRIICEKDNGIAEAFNKGIEASSGEIIGILNSDDKYYDETVLEKVTNCFEDKNVLFVHGNIYFEDPVYGSNIRKPLLCPITSAMPYNHPTMFFRKEVYKEYGRFDTGYNYAMDFEFICRLTKQIDDFYNKGIYLKGEPLVTMAGGGASWKNELDSIEETKRALKQYDFWNFDARKNYILRILRTKLKIFLSKIGLRGIIKKWRKKKWAN
ncbi:MAG: glycosyltransferase family 2 protein [Ignavibacteriaceae bacterium]